MRELHLRQPSPDLVRPASSHEPARIPQAHPARPAEAEPHIDDTLDQAAALWTTRRIRNCVLLLQPRAHKVSQR